MTNFITRLTGITKDDIANAPTTDEVFESFYDWIYGDTNLKFYCYGDADITFIKANLKRTTNMKAYFALSCIAANLTDYAIEVKNYFGLHKTISLKKLIAYYRNVDVIKQNHDALEDSLFLKEVYDHVSNEVPDNNAFLEYKTENKPKNPCRHWELMEKDKQEHLNLIKWKTEQTTARQCNNLYLGIMSCIDRMKSRNSETFDFNSAYPSVRKEILMAIKNKTKYCGYYWGIKED